jgi:hypothetical protein
VLLDLDVRDYVEVGGPSAGPGEGDLRMQMQMTLAPILLASMATPSVEEPYLGVEAAGREIRGGLVVSSRSELEEISPRNLVVDPVVHSDSNPLHSPA